MCLRTCFTRLCGQRPGAMVGQIRTRESECFICPAAEPGSGSLAPLETTSFDPLSDVTLHVRSSNRAACACTATPGFPCYHVAPRAAREAAKRRVEYTELRPGCGRETWGQQQRQSAPGRRRLAQGDGERRVYRRG